MIRRYIQPADPVYHVHPPLPVWGGNAKMAANQANRRVTPGLLFATPQIKLYGRCDFAETAWGTDSTAFARTLLTA